MSEYNVFAFAALLLWLLAGLLDRRVATAPFNLLDRYWVTFSSPVTTATSFIFATLIALMTFVMGISAGYSADSPDDVIPTDIYVDILTPETTAEALAMPIIMLALTLADLIGRFWYAYLLWIPQDLVEVALIAFPVGMLMITASTIFVFGQRLVDAESELPEADAADAVNEITERFSARLAIVIGTGAAIVGLLPLLAAAGLVTVPGHNSPRIRTVVRSLLLTAVGAAVIISSLSDIRGAYSKHE